MTNLYTVDRGKSGNYNLRAAFEGIGVVLSEGEHGFGHSADGVCVKAPCPGGGPHLRFAGVQLWVEDAHRKKVIRRIEVTRDGTLNLSKLRVKFEELKAMVPGIEKQKEERDRVLRQDLESRDQAEAERGALEEEVGQLVHQGDFTLHRRRIEEPYILTLRNLSGDDVRWLAALKRELAGWR